MKKFLFVILAVAVFVIIAFPARYQILKNMGRFLVVRDKLEKSDVIIVLSGENDRVDEAVRLYKEGWAKYMIMTGGSLKSKVNLAAIMRNNAVKLGVPRENIFIEPEARSTYQHPIFVKPIMEKKGFKSAIVVSSPYHMRRVKMLFDRAYRRDGIKTVYYPVQDTWFSPEDWWTKAVSRRAVKMEYVKLCVNVFGNKFSRFSEKLVRR